MTSWSGLSTRSVMTHWTLSGSPFPDTKSSWRGSAAVIFTRCVHVVRHHWPRRTSARKTSDKKNSIAGCWTLEGQSSRREHQAAVLSRLTGSRAQTILRHVAISSHVFCSKAMSTRTRIFSKTELFFPYFKTSTSTRYVFESSTRTKPPF